MTRKYFRKASIFKSLPIRQYLPYLRVTLPKMLQRKFNKIDNAAFMDKLTQP